jgi:hypothetical protein
MREKKAKAKRNSVREKTDKVASSRLNELIDAYFEERKNVRFYAENIEELKSEFSESGKFVLEFSKHFDQESVLDMFSSFINDHYDNLVISYANMAMEKTNTYQEIKKLRKFDNFSHIVSWFFHFWCMNEIISRKVILEKDYDLFWVEYLHYLQSERHRKEKRKLETLRIRIPDLLRNIDLSDDESFVFRKADLIAEQKKKSTKQKENEDMADCYINFLRQKPNLYPSDKSLEEFSEGKFSASSWWRHKKQRGFWILIRDKIHSVEESFGRLSSVYSKIEEMLAKPSKEVSYNKPISDDGTEYIDILPNNDDSLELWESRGDNDTIDGMTKDELIEEYQIFTKRSISDDEAKKISEDGLRKALKLYKK